MTKLEAYRFLSNDCGRDVAWIANVFMTAGGSNCAKSLKALATLVKKGISVGSIGYVMPYERLNVDGRFMTPQEMRDLANVK
jgi:hypothetical protein